MTAPTKRLLSLRSAIRLLIAGTVGVLLGVGAFRLTGTTTLPAQPEGTASSGLSVVAEHLNFGETWESTRFAWVLPIENRQDKDVQIDGFYLSCTCLETEPRSLVIPAGQTREVRLTLDLTDRERKSLPPSLRDFSVSITPRIKSPGHDLPRVDWKVRGRVRSAIYFDKPVVDLGRHSEAAQALPTEKVVVTSLVPLQGLTATSKSDAFQVRVDRMSDDPKRFELAISVLKLPIGPIKAEISVVPQSSDGQPIPGMDLWVTGSVVSDIQASPPAILLGARQVGETVGETVTLQSLSGRSFDVLGMTVQGEGLVVERTPSDGPTFLLKQRILKPGNLSARVLFRVKMMDGWNVGVDVSVSYLGLSTVTR